MQLQINSNSSNNCKLYKSPIFCSYYNLCSGNKREREKERERERWKLDIHFIILENITAQKFFLARLHSRLKNLRVRRSFYVDKPVDTERTRYVQQYFRSIYISIVSRALRQLRLPLILFERVTLCRDIIVLRINLVQGLTYCNLLRLLTPTFRCAMFHRKIINEHTRQRMMISPRC